MIGLDTNVLVRHLTQDDPIQSPLATRIIEQQLTETDPGFVSLPAMVETAWVLKRSYKLSNGEIAAVIEHFLKTETLVVEQENAVFTAMVTLKAGNGSFGDALIAALGVEAGCSKTLTFDRKALRISGFAFP